MSNVMRLLTVLVALFLGACSACPTKGPRAVRIDPAFTAEQQREIAAAVDAWDEMGLTVAISSWDDSDAIPIMRADGLVTRAVPGHPNMAPGMLGLTTVSSKHIGDKVELAGAGAFANGHTADMFDFYSTVAHELGHLYALNSNGDPGVDGHGHSGDPEDLMYNGGRAGDPRRDISVQDRDRVLAAVDMVWP